MRSARAEFAALAACVHHKSSAQCWDARGIALGPEAAERLRSANGNETATAPTTLHELRIMIREPQTKK